MSAPAIGNLYDENSFGPVGIHLTLSEANQSSLQDFTQLRLQSQQGDMVQISDLVSIEKGLKDKNIYRKNQKGWLMYWQIWLVS